MSAEDRGVVRTAFIMGVLLLAVAVFGTVLTIFEACTRPIGEAEGAETVHGGQDTGGSQ